VQIRAVYNKVDVLCTELINLLFYVYSIVSFFKVVVALVTRGRTKSQLNPVTNLRMR
jgi:hypothetical protein